MWKGVVEGCNLAAMAVEDVVSTAAETVSQCTFGCGGAAAAGPCSGRERGGEPAFGGGAAQRRGQSMFLPVATSSYINMAVRMAGWSLK